MIFSKRRGMLIVFSLLFTTIVLMLVGSVLILTRQGRFVSQTHASRIAAIYAAEAGLADAVERLSEDNSWAPTDEYLMKLPNNSASYSFQFASPSTDPDLSVNNLSGATAVDGPLGPGSVPAHSVYLVVNGTAGASSRQLHVVLNTTPFQNQREAFVTSGKIVLRGDVHVTGIKNFNNWDRVEAGIHSNLSGVIPETITWEKEEYDTLFVDGEVTASSVSPAAINIATDGLTGVTASTLAQNFSEPSRRFPDLKVSRAVERAIASSGVTAYTPPTGPGGATITGERKIIGAPGVETVINGDLVLNGANLYVDGDFRVNGSITGDGSIYVKGNTTFSGASEVRVGNIDHTAIYCSGHVTLEGFSGSDYFSAAATSPDLDDQDLAQAHEDALLGLAALQAELEGPNPFSAKTDHLRHFLTATVPASAPAPVDPLNPTAEEQAAITLHGERMSSLVGLPGLSDAADVMAASGGFSRMKAEIASRLTPPPSADEKRTLEFLEKKIVRIESLLADPNAAAPVTAGDWNAYKSSGQATQGLLNYLVANPLTPDASLLANEIRSLHFDALGNSYFKGIIFAGGAIHSTNDVEVFGGLYAHRSSDSPEDPLVVPNPPYPDETYLPGDVILNNGCRVTYVEALVDNPASRLNRNIVVPVSWFTPNVI